jgi:hypothetical protein
MVFKNRLDSLPEIEPLRRLCQSLAMLDAIMSPEWEYRYYSFNSKWASGEMMASMSNGSGDEYHILFTSVGAIIKGFAHESSMSHWTSESEKPWPGVLDEVPPEFQDFLCEPAFSIKDVTFCVWRKHADAFWQIGTVDYPTEADPDGSEELLSILDGDPSKYVTFAHEYYEREISPLAVEQIYRHRLLQADVVSALNADVSIEELQGDVEQVGYPSPE